MTDLNDENTFNLLTENYANIEIILKPNLNTFNIKIVEFLIDSIKGQLKTFLELKNKELNESQTQIINKNTSKLSQSIADFINLIKNRQFSSLSVHNNYDLSYIPEKPSVKNTDSNTNSSLNTGKTKKFTNFRSNHYMNNTISRKAYNDEIYQRNLKILAKNNENMKKNCIHSKNRDELNNHKELHSYRNINNLQKSANLENEDINNIPKKLKKSRSLVFNKSTENKMNKNNAIKNEDLSGSKNKNLSAKKLNEKSNENSIFVIQKPNKQNSRYYTFNSNDNQILTKSPSQTILRNKNPIYGICSNSNKIIGQNSKIIVSNNFQRTSNNFNQIKPSKIAQNLVKKFNDLVEQFTNNNPHAIDDEHEFHYPKNRCKSSVRKIYDKNKINKSKDKNIFVNKYKSKEFLKVNNDEKIKSIS